MSLYKTKIPEVTTSSIEESPQTQDLLGKIGSEIGNTVKAFNELPKKDKIGLVGGAVMLIGYLNLLKKNNDKLSGNTSEKLAGLKESLEIEPDDEDEHFEEESELENEEYKEIMEARQEMESEIWKEGIDLNEADIINKIKSLPPVDRIIYGIRLAMEKYRTGARHCGDWVERVYKAVGCTPKTIYKNLRYEGRDCGDIHAKERDLAKIQPGYHLYYNNKNQASKRGNHSAIFIEWVDYDKKIARVASYYAKSNRLSIHSANFKKNPVTYIGEPQSENPIELSHLQYHLRNEPANIRGVITTETA